MATAVADLDLHAWRSFLVAHARLVARLESELLDEAGLPLTWYEVLLILKESPEGRVRMHELAESRLLSRSAATRLVDRMEAAGLVRRVACDADRRGTFVELSEEGMAAFRMAAPLHVRGIREHFAAHIDRDEAATVATIMNRLVDALGSDTDQARYDERGD